VRTDECEVDCRGFDLDRTPFASVDPGGVTTDSVQEWLDREVGHANHHVFLGYRPGRVAMATMVQSRKPDRVVRGLMQDLKAAAKTQLSGRRPGVLVVQFLELTEADLLDLAAHDSADPRRASVLQLATNQFFENPDRSHMHSIVYRAARGTMRQSVWRRADRIERSYQEQGPTYSFKTPNHPLANDPRYSVFSAR
jgi:hypothetical protein